MSERKTCSSCRFFRIAEYECEVLSLEQRFHPYKLDKVDGYDLGAITEKKPEDRVFINDPFYFGCTHWFEKPDIEHDPPEPSPKDFQEAIRRMFRDSGHLFSKPRRKEGE